MRETILIVDDELEVSSLLAAVLCGRGFRAHGVTSAEECLDLLRRVAVDVVVTDIQMPRCSGLELCRVLHDQYPHVVSLVLTGQVSAEMSAAALDAGAYGFIKKPVTVDALAAIVVRALARRERSAIAAS